MKIAALLAATCLAALFAAGASEAQPVARGDRPVLEIAAALKPGEFVWAPELSLEGPSLLVVNLATQRAVLFRNGVPIAASTVSSGKEGYETPTGVFTILQKHREHYSNLYNNAPMPNMQRLTWGGVALHAGNLPGYPASHGCIRMAKKDLEEFYEMVAAGDTVELVGQRNEETAQLFGNGPAPATQQPTLTASVTPTSVGAAATQESTTASVAAMTETVQAGGLGFSGRW